MADTATAKSSPVTAGAGPSGSPGGRHEPVASVADSFSELQRTVRRSKARLLAAGDDVDSATQLLLHTVAAEGPMRASALAASVQADLSTVSRQVAALVGRGLLERRADQFDGRACLLAVTDAGRAAIADYEHGRQTFFDAVLADWDTEEMRQFARQLERFTAAYDHVHTALMSERARRPDSHPRTTHPRQQP
jgi:DNA-binding MarR family transcriptional regulator